MKIVHIGYSATERQIRTIYNGYKIIFRIKILHLLRWLFNGKYWIFIGEKYYDKS